MLVVGSVLTWMFCTMRSAIGFEQDLRNQVAENAEAPLEPVEIYIGIQTDGSYTVDDEPVSNLKASIQKLTSKHGSQSLLVTIEAAEKSPFGKTVEAMDLIKASGIHRITYTVSSEGGF